MVDAMETLYMTADKSEYRKDSLSSSMNESRHAIKASFSGTGSSRRQSRRLIRRQQSETNSCNTGCMFFGSGNKTKTIDLRSDAQNKGKKVDKKQAKNLLNKKGLLQQMVKQEEKKKFDDFDRVR